MNFNNSVWGFVALVLIILFVAWLLVRADILVIP